LVKERGEYQLRVAVGSEIKFSYTENTFASRLVTWNLANPSQPGVNRSSHEPPT